MPDQTCSLSRRVVIGFASSLCLTGPQYRKGEIIKDLIGPLSIIVCRKQNPDSQIPSGDWDCQMRLVCRPARLRLRPSRCPADLGLSLTRPESGHAHAGTCGHDRPTAATRCAEVPVQLRTERATPKWLVRTLPADCGAGPPDATRPQNSGQVSKSAGPRSPSSQGAQLSNMATVIGSNQSRGTWLIDHAGCGGIQVFPARASRMAASGGRPQCQRL